MVAGFVVVLGQYCGTFIYGGWVCSSVLGQYCGKYHICREKMQLSRAKPGNPASYSIFHTNQTH